MSDPGHSFRFDRYTLETVRGVLLGPDGEIPLRPKSYRVLLYLVTHHGRLVGRQELLDAVWGKAAITDDSLTQCLVEIRRALGDQSRTMVRTVPRRGYLFDVPVAPEPRREPPATGGRDGRDHTRTNVRQPSPLALAVTALVLLALAWLGSGREAAPPLPESTVAVPPAPNGIAVLPFVDMSATRDQTHLGDGIAEEILNTLAQSPDLKVIARTSSFSFRDRPVDIRTIAEHLGVSYVLEGSVRRSGNRVRIVAQLIDARDGAHRWSESFDREPDQILALQSEIAGQVAKALQALLSGAPTGPAIHDVEAYEHFLRRRFLFHRRADGNPDNPLLLGFKAGLALRYGDHATAVERQQRVVRHDPMSPVNRRLALTCSGAM